MSRNTYSEPRLFLGNREINTFSAITYKNDGKKTSSLNITLSDPQMDESALLGQDVVFYLNYGSTDSVPFFRGTVKQYMPTDKNIKLVVNDVLGYLTGTESPPLNLTDDNNYDGFTLGQMLHNHISTVVNKSVTKAKLTGAWMYNMVGTNFGADYEPARFSADGAYLATIAGQSSSAQLALFATQIGLNHTTGAITPVWVYDFDATIFSVDISDDGEYIVAGSGIDVYVFDKDSSTPAWIYDESGAGDDKKSVGISGDGVYVVAGEFYGRHIHLWTRANGNVPTWSYNSSEQIDDIDISNDGGVIAASSGNKLFVFNEAAFVAGIFETTSMSATDGTTPGNVNIDGVDFAIGTNQTAAQIAATIADVTYPNYTAAVTNTDRVTFTQRTAGTIGNVAFTMSDAVYVKNSTPENHTIAKQGGGTDFAGGADSLTWTRTLSTDVTALAVSEDGNYIVTGDRDNVVELYGKASATPLWTSAVLDSGDAEDIAISEDGSSVVAVSDVNPNSKIYHFSGLDNVPDWEFTAPNAGVFKSVDMSDDGKFIVAGYRVDDGSTGQTFLLDDKGNLVEYKLIEEEAIGVSIGKSTFSSTTSGSYYYASVSGDGDDNTSNVHIYEYSPASTTVYKERIGLDMLNDTNPPVTLTGYRGKNVSPLKVIQANLPKKTTSFTDIKNTRLIVRDDGKKSNICFAEEQDIDSAGINFSFNNGIEKITYKRRPPPNFYSVLVNKNIMQYQHDTLPTGIHSGKLEGKFEYPDQARQEAFIQATLEEDKKEISITVNKGLYLELGNVIVLNTPEHPELTGKHRIVGKSLNIGKSKTTCKLTLSKEPPQVSDYLSSS